MLNNNITVAMLLRNFGPYGIICVMYVLLEPMP
jgi:hypothetical protein